MGDMTTATANAVHMPRNFDPMAYEFVDAFDAEAGDPGARGNLPAEMFFVPEFDASFLAYSPLGASKLACRDALAGSPSSTFEKGSRGTQCDHCGAHLRYVCVIKHMTTGDFIAVGETCLDNRVQSMTRATWKVKQLREAAQRIRQAEKNREARESWLSENPAAAAMLAREDLNWCFLVNSVREAVAKYGSCFEWKVEKALRFVAESDARNAEQAQRAAERATEVRVAAPVGRLPIEGVVVSRKVKEGDYGSYVKLVIVCGDAAGKFAVYVTEPSSIETERGDIVRLTATLKRSDRDESFAFASKPAKAEIVGRKDDTEMALDSLAPLEGEGW